MQKTAFSDGAAVFPIQNEQTGTGEIDLK